MSYTLCVFAVNIVLVIFKEINQMFDLSVKRQVMLTNKSGTEVIKLFFVLNSTEHGILNAH